ncbi:PREDICTED: target of Myb protein 1-like [Populus euphratica]|uniref:Target of Myb protein 1-like n=1 Tax=Populus euphratica TaxID=75702 RepID=A0AAJ6T2P2_POPEU|nr:PREDICTED: target of Myb protein 1-like [Populus euphratica]
MARAMGMGLGLGSSSSATVAVDKATSDLLIGPDWTMNIDICDSVNSNYWQAKDVVKALKKRLQHKSPRVQLLALTLLETMVKNCGDYVHFQIAERNILGEMVKIVKKKTDMHVRDKILALIDSWQEAFGGPGGKHSQYYWAYEELRRAGVQFPQRSSNAAPIFTPPATNPTLRHAQPGYGMPSNSSSRLDETMAAEIEGLSVSSLDSMRDVMELLSDMLQAVNPRDREAVKDEVIVDLVNQCRSNQKKLMQMLTTTGDEELLGKGLELNDSMQILLAKHDAIASGSPMPTQVTSLSPKSSEGCSSDIKPTEARDASPRSMANSVMPVANMTRSAVDEEDEEDDFAKLARRHSKTQSGSSQSSGGTNGALVPLDAGMPTASTSSPCNSLALADPSPPVKAMKDQDMIDFLSLALSTTSTSPPTPPVSNQPMPQIPPSSSTQGYPYVSQTYPVNQGPVPYNSYVVPWAQPQTQQHQLQSPSQTQLQPHSYQHLRPPSQPQQQLQPEAQQQSTPQPQQHLQHQSKPQLQPQFQPQLRPEPQQQSVPQPQQRLQHQSQPQLQPQFQPQLQPQHPQYSSVYPPPPWASTPGYLNNQNHTSTTNNMFSSPRSNSSASYTPMQAARPMQQFNSLPTRAGNGSIINGDSSSASRVPAPPGQKQSFVPSYKLFDDLNVLGNSDGRFKMNGSTPPSLSGSSGQSMVGGRK